MNAWVAMGALIRRVPQSSLANSMAEGSAVPAPHLANANRSKTRLTVVVFSPIISL